MQQPDPMRVLIPQMFIGHDMSIYLQYPKEDAPDNNMTQTLPGLLGHHANVWKII